MAELDQAPTSDCCVHEHAGSAIARARKPA
jgi:hypothetical protein